MKRLIAALAGISIMFFAGCAGDKATKDALKNAEVLMDERPEESLEILETIDREMLTSRKEKAEFALLYSMALDKNYIDLQSDSIISPAVKYYRYHGTAREKLQSLYYLGRIYYNAGDTEEAMRQYVEAERYVTNTDNIIAGRLYKAKAIAYQDIYDFNSALEQAQFAADRFYAARDTVRYINTLIDTAVIYCLLAKYEDADNCLRLLKSKFDILNERQISNYYAILLNASLINSPDSVQSILSEYLTTVTNDSLINWLYVSEAYSSLGDYSAASTSLDKYISYGGLKDAAYYWTSATLLEKIGDLSSAIEAYKRYLEITDDDDLSIFYADTKFIEERYINELHRVKLQMSIIIVVLSLILLVIGIVVLYRRIMKLREQRKQEKIVYDKERELILSEKTKIENLTHIAANRDLTT